MLVHPVDDFPRTLIVSFQDAVENYFLINRYSAEKAAEIRCGNMTSVYRFDHQGRTLGFFRSNIGGSAAALIIEKAIAMGAKNFVFFGSCGMLNQNLLTGSFVVPTEAYRDEGVSYHYSPATDYIPVQNAKLTSEVMKDLGLTYSVGRVWTTDAFFRETRRNLQRRLAEHCIAVDMECASLAAVCNFRRVAYRYFFFTADMLSSDSWQRNNLGNTPSSVASQSLLAAIEMALRMESNEVQTSISYDFR